MVSIMENVSIVSSSIIDIDERHKDLFIVLYELNTVPDSDWVHFFHHPQKHVIPTIKKPIVKDNHIEWKIRQSDIEKHGGLIDEYVEQANIMYADFLKVIEKEKEEDSKRDERNNLRLKEANALLEKVRSKFVKK